MCETDLIQWMDVGSFGRGTLCVCVCACSYFMNVILTVFREEEENVQMKLC